MTWLSLLRRAWAVWKLRKVKINLCRWCSVPLIESERIDCCDDCYETKSAEQAKANNDIPMLAARGMLQGSYAQILAPGLMGAFGSARQAMIAQQQQQLGAEALRRQQEQQMNMDQHDVLRNMLGQGLLIPPKKQ